MAGEGAESSMRCDVKLVILVVSRDVVTYHKIATATFHLSTRTTRYNFTGSETLRHLKHFELTYIRIAGALTFTWILTREVSRTK